MRVHLRKFVACTTPLVIVAASTLWVAACAPRAGGGYSNSPAPASGASAQANLAADRATYQPIQYSGTPGPAVVVLEGDIKSANATFTQKVTANNIADFAEIELGQANFKVLERSALGGLTREFQIAYGLGDPDTARMLLGKGKFKATRWVLRFDILKAEPVAAASRGFSAAPLSSIAGSFIGGIAGSATRTAGASTRADEEAQVWIVGMRYTVIDAATTEQRASGYFERKMEIGSRAQSTLGFSRSEAGGLTLDSLAQRLVQDSVAEIDQKYK